ncbi:MAG: hypothetical protein OXB88_03000 [Bacteriovoracales bacterium]|nr:hypothetical protein [Bacteriovoracales bacterium]
MSEDQRQGIKCPIWGNDVTVTEDQVEKDFFTITSSRAGGFYKIHKNDRNSWEELQDGSAPKHWWNELRAKITTWIIDQRNKGEICPTVKSFEKCAKMNLYKLPIGERINRLLEHLYSFSRDSNKINFFDRYNNNINYAKAFSECVSESDWDMILNYVVNKKNYLEKINDRLYRFSVEGFKHLESLERNVDSSQAFVSMWFSDEMNSCYEKAIEPVIREMGYDPIRIDKKEHNGKIDDKIIAEIKRSKFLIADFSCGEDGARGGVYYEAGFAHGLNIPVIFTCRKGDEEKLHFDTRQFNHIVWESEEDLKKQLKDRIEATIGDGPLRRGHP